jgi:hypothetical protein
LEKHLKTHVEGLLKIRKASACRENWLHGQLFLSEWSHVKCWVNEFPYPEQAKGDYSKADLALGTSLKAPELVAEIKFVGTKNYDKSKLKVPAAQFWDEIEKLPEPKGKPGRRLCKLAGNDLRRMTSWGIIHDFFRLADLQEVKERVLILVLDRHPKGPDKAGRLFESIAFEGREVEILGPEDSKELLIRAWVLPGVEG